VAFEEWVVNRWMPWCGVVGPDVVLVPLVVFLMLREQEGKGAQHVVYGGVEREERGHYVTFPHGEQVHEKLGGDCEKTELLVEHILIFLREGGGKMRAYSFQNKTS